MNYRVRITHRQAGLRQLEEAWTELLLAASSATVFASWQWNAAWWRHFGQGNRLYMLTVWAGAGRLVGVAPLMLRRFGPVRKLEFIGAGLSDYGDILLHPEHTRGALEAILAYLAAHRYHWDLADLGEVSVNSPMLRFLRAYKPLYLRVAMVPQTPCPAITLPATWEEYVQSLARKRRYYVSSFPRKFMREHSGSVATVTGGRDVVAAIGTFHALHMRRWSAREKDLSREHLSPGFEPFLREACMRCAEKGWLRVVALRAGDKVVASSLNFLVHGRWSGYMKGFDPEWSLMRPGTVLDALRIKTAIEEGASRFDFGRGDEEYKSGYGIEVERNTRVLIASNSVFSSVAYAVLMARIRRRSRLPVRTDVEVPRTSEE